MFLGERPTDACMEPQMMVKSSTIVLCQVGGLHNNMPLQACSTHVQAASVYHWFDWSSVDECALGAGGGKNMQNRKMQTGK